MLEVNKAGLFEHTTLAVIGDQHGEFGDARLRHVYFKLTQKSPANAEAAVVLIHNQENDPALFVGNAPHNDTNDRVPLVGHNRVVFIARGQDLGKRVNRLKPCAAGLVPQIQHSVGIDRLKVPKPRAHCALLPSAPCSNVSRRWPREQMGGIALGLETRRQK